MAVEVLPSHWPSSQPCPTSRQAPASPCRPRSPVAAPMGAQLQDSDREAGSQTVGETVGQQGAQEATRGPAPAYTQLDPQPLTLVPRAAPPGRPPDHYSESPALRRRHLGHAGLNFSSTKRPGPSLVGCLGGSGGGAWCPLPSRAIVVTTVCAGCSPSQPVASRERSRAGWQRPGKRPQRGASPETGRHWVDFPRTEREKGTSRAVEAPGGSHPIFS